MTTETTLSDQLIEANNIDPVLYERVMYSTLQDIHQYLDERITRDQVESVLRGSEAHALDVLEAIQHLALTNARNDAPGGAVFECSTCGTVIGTNRQPAMI